MDKGAFPCIQFYFMRLKNRITRRGKRPEFNQIKTITACQSDGFIIKTNSFSSFLSYHNLHPTEEKTLLTKSKKHRFLLKWKQNFFRPLFNHYGKLIPQLQSDPLLLQKISKGASFAGQYETYLNIKTDEEFLQGQRMLVFLLWSESNRV
ncbi:hypothetical protein ACEQPO_26005 [Bacillus sp. SL00103]